MKQTLTISVPGEPVGKGRPQFVPATGRAHTPKKTAKYENLVAVTFQNKYPDWVESLDMVSVEISAYFSIPKSWSKKKQAMARNELIRPTKAPDADNISKTKDALNHIAWKDDAQVIEEHIYKYYSDRPRVEFTLTFLDADELLERKLNDGICKA